MSSRVYLWGINPHICYLCVCTQAGARMYVERELLSVSLLWVSEPTNLWVLFRSKKLVGGSGILGSGDRGGKKGAQESGIS